MQRGGYAAASHNLAGSLKMEEGDGGGDSLFSLELLVESARVEPRLLPPPLAPSGPFRPAVALRLLDFPTLLVRAPHCVVGPLVPFGRGKSCLFRLRASVLRDLLRRSPLHALLLALPPSTGPARLLGSCSVSLASAAEELLVGTGPGGRRGRFPLRDLMGEPVGELGLSYRLCNLGCTLLGHLEEGAASGEPHCEEPQQAPRRPTPLDTQGKRGQSQEFMHEVKNQESSQKSGSQDTYTEPQPSGTGCGDIARELDAEANVFCPPPMYYNCPAEDCSPAPKACGPEMVAKTQESFQKEQHALPPAMPAKEEPLSDQEASPSLQNLVSNPQQLRQTLSQLPLLNALLVELSLLNNQTLQPGPSAVHPRLAWLYQNVEDSPPSPPPHVKSVSPTREDKKTNHKERGRSPTLMLRRNHPQNLKCISPSFQRTWTGFKASVYETKGSPEKYSKENSPPRRKLTYGMTNTLRLRLQQTNPDMLKIHEKREHRRKKQANVLMKGSISLAKGKTFRCSERHPKSGSALSDERGISDQNVQFNENIETLIQCSIEQDHSITRKDITSDVQNNVAGGRVKSRENIKERCPFKRIGSGYKEKRLKVHLPRVSLQDTDTLENIIDMEGEKRIQDNDGKISVLQNSSQSNPIESHREYDHSDDVIVSCENGGYSEDFTNADSSSFEAKLSTSEPLVVNQNPSHSDTDSNAKISGESLASESASSLFPIPSSVSPVQLLKKTSFLQSNDQNTGVQYKYNHDDSPPTRTPKEELLDQQIKKEEKKDVEAFESQQVSSDFDGRGAQGQPDERSLSLRTSQVSSYMPSNVSNLSELESNASYKEEEDDDFEMPEINNQCKHVSELIVNKLPGYTM